MSNVEVVIKIPKEMWEQVEKGYVPLGISKYLKNGVTIPKGHGDLIDVNDIKVIELEDSLHIIRHEKGDEIDVYIEAPTVIKADIQNEE